MGVPKISNPRGQTGLLVGWQSERMLGSRSLRGPAKGGAGQAEGEGGRGGGLC